MVVTYCASRRIVGPVWFSDAALKCRYVRLRPASRAAVRERATADAKANKPDFDPLYHSVRISAHHFPNAARV